MIGPTVTVQRATTVTDDYGNTGALSWTSPTEMLVTLLAPPAPRREAALAEFTDRRQGALFGYTLYMPSSADVKPADRVLLWGDTFDVDGEPGRWESGIGSTLGGIEVDVIRAD